MATKEESPLTRDDVQSLITETVTDIVGKVFLRSSEDTTKQVNGAVARLSESISKLSNRFETVEALSTEVSATKTQLAELFTALQAPDDDPTQPSNPQEIDVEAITAKIKAEVQEAAAQQWQGRVQALEQRVIESDANAEKIRQQQIESDRNNALIASLKKVAPELNLFPDHEDVVMSKLAKDGVLQVSEDGTSWLAKTKRQDPYTKQVEEVVVPATPDILKSIIADGYSYYQQPRGGAGTNAAPTQSYNPANRKITDSTTATDIQKIFKEGDAAAQEEIAALILAQG